MSKKHVCVCIGKSCGPLGGRDILEQVQLAQQNEKTYHTVTTTRCLGHCSYAPNMTVNDKLHNTVDPTKAAKIIRDDNPKDLDVGSREKTDPNDTMRADEIIDANNFLGDLS